MLVAMRRKISSHASFVNQGGCHACSAPFLFGLRNLRKEKGTDAYLRDKETINLPEKDLSPALRMRGGGAPTSSRKTARKIGPGARGEGQREANKKTRNKKLPKRSIAKASARKRARIAKKKASAPTNNAEPDSREGEGSDDKIVDGVTRFDGANANALPHESSQSDDYLQQRGGASSSNTDMTVGEHAAKGEAVWGQGGIGEILNAPGGPLDLGSMNTGSVGGFRPPEYDMFEEELKKLEFDGVFDVEHVNVSDPAVVHQLLHDIPLSVEKAYDALAEIGEATNAIREMEADMSDDALENAGELVTFLKMKRRIYNSYMQHLYVYCLLKVEGEWFPGHRVAANLRELRLMLLHMREQEKALAPQMIEAVRKWSADASEAAARPAAAAEKAALLAGPPVPPRVSSGEESRIEGPGRGGSGAGEGGRMALRKDGGGVSGGEGGAEGPAAAWRPPVAWKAGIDVKDESLSHPSDYWQQLFWEAVRLQDEVKVGKLDPTDEQQLFIGQLAFFEERWEAAFDAGGRGEEEDGEISGRKTRGSALSWGNAKERDAGERSGRGARERDVGTQKEPPEEDVDSLRELGEQHNGESWREMGGLSLRMV